MKPTPFDLNQDLPPIPFDERHCQLAYALKEAGLKWQPHVGCFVWDKDRHIQVNSPFPGNIYFILNLNHFLRRFETEENIAAKLVWMPTWHQTRLLCQQHDIVGSDVEQLWNRDDAPISPGDELLDLYEILLFRLQGGHAEPEPDTVVPNAHLLLHRIAGQRDFRMSRIL